MMGGENDVCESCNSTIWLRYAVFCQTCQKHKHRKCEKVASGVVLENYMCKKCKRDGKAGGSDLTAESGAETSKAVGNRMDSDSSLRCELCEQLAEENGRLIQERDSLKEIIVQLRKDMEELKSNRQNEVQEKDPNQWVDIPTRSDKCEKPRRRKSVVELRNRFEVLSECSGNDCENSAGNVVSGCVSGSASRKVKPKKKKKVLLVSSSQGRYCSQILGDKLGKDFEVSSVVKPNAKFRNVVESVDKLVKNYGKDDCVIVLAGGNDEEDSDFRENLSDGVKQIMALKNKTRVIVNALPPRYDKEELMGKVRLMNRFLHSEINTKGNWDNKNIQVNFAMERMERMCFTRHGLHLNKYGKQVFCDRMVKLLRDFEKMESDKQITFLGN